ncbi:MAG: ribosomal L7Ae/L30e/S12e/Gadd45 family protein [Clostridia bacterium]|nr:ribosomal L7Ae/L30e/S12e/Gadd45 family protein [Clostridia bacterium]
MPERLKKRAMRVVGVRQVLRAIKQERAEMIFLAMDAGPQLRGAVEQAAKEANVPLQMVATMEELASLCRVDVPSAAAAVYRNEMNQ